MGTFYLPDNITLFRQKHCQAKINFFSLNRYSSFSSSFNVNVIDGSSNEIIQNVATELAFPTDITINDVTNRVYILDSFSFIYCVIDGVTNKVIGKGPIGNVDFCDEGPLGSAQDLAVNAETNRIYLSFSTGESCKQIIVTDGSNNEIIDSLKGVAPIDLAVNSELNQIYGLLAKISGDDNTDNALIKIDGETNEISNSIKSLPPA